MNDTISSHGKLREKLAQETRGLPIAFPGFEKDRERLAPRAIYVPGMADETFGFSVIEAHAAGLALHPGNQSNIDGQCPNSIREPDIADDSASLRDRPASLEGAYGNR